MSDAPTEVDRTLAHAGLPVTPEERERLICLYPAIQEWTATIRLPESRYAEPALVYRGTTVQAT